MKSVIYLEDSLTFNFTNTDIFIFCLQEGVKTENDHINLKVAGQDGSVVQFKIKRHTPLSKLMKAYCERQVIKLTLIPNIYAEYISVCPSSCLHSEIWCWNVSQVLMQWWSKTFNCSGGIKQHFTNDYNIANTLHKIRLPATGFLF